MNIKNILNKITKRNKKEESKDSYCYSNIIWNTEDNLIILISFSKDYFMDIIDIQDALNNSGLYSKMVYSSYDEETDMKDNDGNNIWIIHKKYYLLIGGYPLSWITLYTNINDLHNSVLYKITDEITNNCNRKYFKLIIDDGIISFKNNDIKYDNPIYVGDAKCTDPKVLFSRLPNGFTGRDILKFIGIDDSNTTCTLQSYIIKNICSLRDNDSFKKCKLYPLFESIYKNPTLAKVKMSVEPLYKQTDDDSIAGDVDDESLDDIFRKHYERFSAVTDDNILYEDIDEELSEYDEEIDSDKEG